MKTQKRKCLEKKTSIFIIFPGPVLKSTDIRCQQSLTQNHMRSYEIHDMKHVASDNLFIHVSDPSFTLITKDSSAVTRAGNTAHKPSKAAATRPCLEHIEASDCWLLHSLIFPDVTMMSQWCLVSCFVSFGCWERHNRSRASIGRTHLGSLFQSATEEMNKMKTDSQHENYYRYYWCIYINKKHRNEEMIRV